VEAEQAVVDALSFRVADNVLFVESAANFSTGRPIKVTIAMPQDALQIINHQGTGERCREFLSEQPCCRSQSDLVHNEPPL
jgi:hypothetical protein